MNKITKQSPIKAIAISAVITIIITISLSILSVSNGGFATTLDGPNTISKRMTWPVIIHLGIIIPALFLGGYILWNRKGDRLHKFLGKIWCVLMIITATATIFIGGPGGGIAGSGFSFLHIFTIITYISVPYAIWAVKHKNVESHLQAMRGLYIGTFIAGAFAFLPGRIMHILAFG